MFKWVQRRVYAAYERLLKREISGAPAHVAVIQDGNRRYASKQDAGSSEGYQAGAKTTEEVLNWCKEIGVEELTLYTFSTENFDRPGHEQEVVFDLLEEKLYEFSDDDRVHDSEVCIRVIGEVERLPERVRKAVEYAEHQTAHYDKFTLNIALAYGGRNELLGAAREVVRAVERDELDPEDIDVSEIENRIYDRPLRNVDLIIRTGGDERTSNFLPWYANGNEAAVFFCTPYWPEFSRVDFLRAVRTYESREKSWRRTRAKRALALLKAFGDVELTEAHATVEKFRNRMPEGLKADEQTIEELEVDS
ncbi:di-trans,poly-cis-decaprenylcistransferase [Halorubrum sp. C3]|nr:di-trans,poly-cis-decaprenylcistransferase [Halorubrum sp. C3]